MKGGRTDPQPALRKILKERFLLGAALNDAQIAGQDPAALEIVRRHFSAISPENVLKWDAIHPEPDRFEFAAGDQYVALGAKCGLFVVGHVLVWHEQTPRWVFEGAPGTAADRKALLSRLRAHVRTVVGRYRGRVRAWDVVNEAFEDDGTWRKTPWYVALGEEYVSKAFEFAHEADPDAQLYYNDYNLWKPAKREAAVRLVRSLSERGIRIDGVGEQGHWLLDGPSAGEIEMAIVDFAKLGRQIIITELDVRPIASTRGVGGSRRVEANRANAGSRPLRERSAQRRAGAVSAALRRHLRRVCEAPRGQPCHLLGRYRC